jgi:hypothetical protein
MAVPVETKVQASTVAAGVSCLTLWVLGRYVFKGAVPDVVASWMYALVPGALTFVAGYFARHTPRPDLPPVLPVSVPPSPPAPVPPVPLG